MRPGVASTFTENMPSTSAKNEGDYGWLLDLLLEDSLPNGVSGTRRRVSFHALANEDCVSLDYQ